MQLEAAQKELLQVLSDLRKARVELAILDVKEKAATSQEIPESELDRARREDPEFQDLLQQIEEEKQILEELKTVTGNPAHPGLRHQQEVVLALEREMGSLVKKLTPKITESIRKRQWAEWEPKKASFPERIAYLQGMEKALTADIQRLELDLAVAVPSTEERLRTVEKEVQELKEELKKRR
jgi:hypothetical protein